MAERVRRKGIRQVTGDLVVDDTAFDGASLPPAFEQKDEVAAYRASVSAVAANFGAMTMIVTPAEPGKPPTVSFDPPNDYALITNRATTLEKREAAAKKPLILDLKEEGGRSRAILSGSTHTKGGASLRRRVESPSLYTGYLFLQALKTVGVKVKGEVKRGTRGKGRLLARHRSYTMVYLLSAMQKWSNNFMAEMMFKSLALGDTPATWEGAQARAAAFLKKAGVKDGYKITNGSGLYDANELSAEQFTQVLYYVHQRRDLLPDFETTLAIAGTDGTLKRRMRGQAKGMSRAKTGTLNRVVTLSGYAYTKGGHKVAYSILFNKTRGGAWAYRKLQDDFVEALISNY
jgi:D-alanyl-D-alanine carboxypeptidase/D-alanyl-D-alanine-endopeptidase (penicillin-binding protein 4)